MTKQLEQTIAKIEALPDDELLVYKGETESVGLDTDDLKALAAEVKRLREGLEHYADIRPWNPCDDDDESLKHYTSEYANGYDHARKILDGGSND